jgi:hypothetical protein
VFAIRRLLVCEGVVKSASNFFSDFGTKMRAYFIIEIIGGVLNFWILAVPVFAGQYDHVPPAELGSCISRNAFYSLYLIFKLTSLVELVEDFSEFSAYSNRIRQLWNAITNPDWTS